MFSATRSLLREDDRHWLESGNISNGRQYSRRPPVRLYKHLTILRYLNIKPLQSTLILYLINRETLIILILTKEQKSYEQADGNFYIVRSSDNGITNVAWGYTTDSPVAAYDSH